MLISAQSQDADAVTPPPSAPISSALGVWLSSPDLRRVLSVGGCVGRSFVEECKWQEMLWFLSSVICSSNNSEEAFFEACPPMCICVTSEALFTTRKTLRDHADICWWDQRCSLLRLGDLSTLICWQPCLTPSECASTGSIWATGLVTILSQMTTILWSVYLNSTFKQYILVQCKTEMQFASIIIIIIF